MKSLLLFALGAPELIVIVVLVLLLFGGKKIPELARGLGKGIREFKSAKNQIKDEIENAILDEKIDIYKEGKNMNVYLHNRGKEVRVKSHGYFINLRIAMNNDQSLTDLASNLS